MKIIKKLAQKILGLFILIGILTGYPIEARPLKAKTSQKTTQASRAKQTVRTKKSTAKANPRIRKTVAKIKKGNKSLTLKKVAVQRRTKHSVREVNSIKSREQVLSQKNVLQNKNQGRTIIGSNAAKKADQKPMSSLPFKKNTSKQQKVVSKIIRKLPASQLGKPIDQKAKEKISLSKNASVKKKQKLSSQLATRLEHPVSLKDHVELALKVKSPQQEFLDAKLIKVSHKRLLGNFSDESKFHACDVGYTNLPRTKQYSILNLPAAPILHPYNPIDSDTMKEYFLPAYTLNVKLPKVETSFLPKALQSVLQKELKTGAIKKIEAYVEVQDMPWQPGANEQIPLLLRPLYWCSPEEPNERKEVYNNSFIVKTGLFSEKPTFPKLIGQRKEELVTQGLCIHNGGPNQPLVSSGNTLPVSGVIKTISHAFYSLTIYKERAAITKHLILNNSDELEFEKLLKESTTLQDLKEKLLRNRKVFSNSEFVDEFKDLWTFNE